MPFTAAERTRQYQKMSKKMKRFMRKQKKTTDKEKLQKDLK